MSLNWLHIPVGLLVYISTWGVTVLSSRRFYILDSPEYFIKKLSLVYKHNKNILICNSAGGFGGLQDPSGGRKFGSGT
jgi:hypothetical protein